MRPFRVSASFSLAGDQAQAVTSLTDGFIKKCFSYQTLKGVTGSGKTYTMAKLIEGLQCPILVLSHNKTLAAQLYREFKNFFPDNAVEYFVSYYDYYQPEAYLPSRDLYIEKDASRNEEIEKLRLAATTSLMERSDVIIVSTVSCIYGLGDPSSYRDMRLSLKVGERTDLKQILDRLVAVQYERNDTFLERGRCRVRGDVLDIYPTYANALYRITLDWDRIESIGRIHPQSGEVLERLPHCYIYPEKHFVVPHNRLLNAMQYIHKELQEQIILLQERGKLSEAERLKRRTEYDLEMMSEVGYCSGIENYSRHLSCRQEGQRPFVLLDYFPDRFVLFIDESHVTLPQIRAMYAGDRSRKETLVDFGFRLPSALDNRPLTHEEFWKIVPQVLFVSATPGGEEAELSSAIVEQLIRPTGLLDPTISVRGTAGQMENLYQEIQKNIKHHERVLVTTLTKKMAEDLTDYLLSLGIKARYLHSEIDTLERVALVRDLRLGVFDVLVGINLLREGLDLPEVSLVAIMDADKVGFLRSTTTLIQTIGRVARNTRGRVVMYADRISPPMREAIGETQRRRSIQLAHNKAQGIVPRTIIKEVDELLEEAEGPNSRKKREQRLKEDASYTPSQREALIKALEKKMLEKARTQEYEEAAGLRDRIFHLRERRKKGKTP